MRSRLIGFVSAFLLMTSMTQAQIAPSSPVSNPQPESAINSVAAIAELKLEIAALRDELKKPRPVPVRFTLIHFLYGAFTFVNPDAVPAALDIGNQECARFKGVLVAVGPYHSNSGNTDVIVTCELTR